MKTKTYKCIYINTALHSRLKIMCSIKGLQIKAFLESIINKELNKFDQQQSNIVPLETYPPNQYWSDVESDNRPMPGDEITNRDMI